MAKGKYISFFPEMQDAIMAGIKTQTRRVIRPQPPDGVQPSVAECYWQPGDLLMVRKSPEIRRANINLRARAVRPERLCAITEEDALAEGFGSIAEFAAFWDRINAGRGHAWDTNPWVYVVTFSLLRFRCVPPGAAVVGGR